MRCSEIGVGISKEQFCDFLNSVRRGQFFHVRGYVNQHGEIADHILRFGIGYGNLKRRDVGTLEAVLRGEKTATIGVTHGVWIPEDATTDSLSSTGPAAVQARIRTTRLVGGVSVPVDATTGILLSDPRLGNKEGKGRVQATISYSLPTSHPAVVAAIGSPTTDRTLLKSLINPKTPAVEYDKQAKSCYSLPPSDKHPYERWYIRDVLSVWKHVRKDGEYGFSASLPHVAIKKAIGEALLITSNYREFGPLSQGNFEEINIEGQAILCDGLTEELFFALPETLKAVREGAAA